mmetsp:Transcript_5125/g.10847  ORF Transcript_5125/g.10847 Transcript_5125/m.10847 type:complete len:398 (-) Transcript_5125:147-1340(-)
MNCQSNMMLRLLSTLLIVVFGLNERVVAAPFRRFSNPSLNSAFLHAIRGGGSLDSGSSDLPTNKTPSKAVEELNSDEEDGEVEDEEELGAETVDLDSTVDGPTELVNESATSSAEDAAVDVAEELLVDDPTIDEDSSANVDRMEYADAYDDEEEEQNVVDYGASAPSSEEVVTDAATTDGGEVEEFSDTLPTIALASEITEEMKTIMLKELKYRASDLKVIRPEIASIIVAKMVERPAEGLPAHWYKERAATTAAASSSGKEGRTARKILISAVATTLAIGLGSKVDFSSTIGGGLSMLKPSPSAPKPSMQENPYQAYHADIEEIKKESQSVYAAIEEAKKEPETTPVSTTPEPVVDPMHDHSVRPGEKYPAEPIDETWLDKGITAVERRLKSLFGL